MPAFISLRQYAKRRGVSAMAVSLAVKSGRLRESVTRDENGQPKIADPDLADREWAANTDLTDAPSSVVEASRNWPGATKAPAPSAESGDDSTAEAARREKWAKAKLAEIKLREAQGELVVAADVERKLVDTFTRCKTRLLGIPSRARQQLPQLTTADVGVLEQLVREALEELAAESER